MKKKHKELILGLHFALCLLALTAEPTGEKATAFYIAYYLIVLANMAASVVLINNHMQKYYDTEQREMMRGYYQRTGAGDEE